MIFFSDLDGTFLDSRKHVPARSWEALDAIARASDLFVPCSGRPLAGIPHEILAHPAVRFAVSANGACVSELDPAHPGAASARTLHTALLTRAHALACWELARDRDVTFDVFADGTCYLRRDLYERIDEFAGDPYMAQSMRDTRTPVDEDAPATIARVHQLERVSMYWHDPRDRAELTEALSAMEGIDLTRSYPMNIEVMEAGASKGAALAWLCGHLGIAVENAVAFGDNLNDLSMILAAGTGVAVANAEAEVRSSADAVCASNDEAGVGAFILERYAQGPAHAPRA